MELALSADNFTRSRRSLRTPGSSFVTQEDPSYRSIEDEHPQEAPDLMTRLRSYQAQYHAFVEAKVIPFMDDVAEILRRLTVRQASYIGGGVTLFLILFVAWALHSRPAQNFPTASNTRSTRTASKPLQLAVQPKPAVQGSVTIGDQAATPHFDSTASPQLQQADNSQTVDISTSKDVNQQDEPADQAQAPEQSSAQQTEVKQPKPSQPASNPATGGDVPPPPDTNGDPGAGTGSDPGNGG